MASFIISKASEKGKAWKAVGNHPITGKLMCMQGGRINTIIGGSPARIKAFNARHEAVGISPKKYINALRWQSEAPFGSTIQIPNDLF